jgi:hypothetical protein
MHLDIHREMFKVAIRNGCKVFIKQVEERENK